LQLGIKLIADLIAAATLLFLLTPLAVVISLAILCDDGRPVFFRQERVGRNGRSFRIWKFRTMVPDADNLLDEQGRGGSHRVTRMGRFLRLTSLDELPQLLNILCGQMAFVGPRPGLREHYERYTAEQKGRYAMRPGVTGLAQVTGRNSLPWSQRIALDLQYIRAFSLWLDAVILARTVAVVLTRRGAALDRNPDQVDDLMRMPDGKRK
jgi:lipopolysaccharide/colanic/teichoic acid biosynthesis glycosyltransferase